ncbi:MAG: hypothetical protein CM15mP74_08710 [Halieaceae bacterium]|nr:MAG: hypothetical protein CM15mP74_08710 [Halieaceae bacterium]
MDDPPFGELLTPRATPSAQTPALGHGFYETFNRDNVKLGLIKGPSRFPGDHRKPAFRPPRICMNLTHRLAKPGFPGPTPERWKRSTSAAPMGHPAGEMGESRGPLWASSRRFPPIFYDYRPPETLCQPAQTPIRENVAYIMG